MRNSSTGNASPAGGANETRRAAKPAESGGRTHLEVDGGPAPRAPHERDESADSGSGGPSEIGQRAHDDVVSGKVGGDKGEPTEAVYRRHLRGKTPGSERD